MTSWHSYPKVYAIGHAAIREIFLDDVIVEEKVDGSQFSFGRFNGELRCKSRNQECVLDNAGMFQIGVNQVSMLPLKDGWTYRGEYLQKPKHNALAYQRTPNKNTILFDVNTGTEKYLSRDAKLLESERLGIEIVPIIFRGRITSIEQLEKLLDRESILGGVKIEGVVVKNYNRFSRDGKAMIGKVVSAAFKETHAHEWKQDNPQSGDIVQSIVAMLRTDARWEKAVQHLRDDGKLKGEPSDIGPLIKAAQADITEECKAQIQDILWSWARDKVLRGSVAGLAEWYKERVTHSAFEEAVK